MTGARALTCTPICCNHRAAKPIADYIHAFRLALSPRSAVKSPDCQAITALTCSVTRLFNPISANTICYPPSLFHMTGVPVSYLGTTIDMNLLARTDSPGRLKRPRIPRLCAYRALCINDNIKNLIETLLIIRLLRPTPGVGVGDKWGPTWGPSWGQTDKSLCDDSLTRMRADVVVNAAGDEYQGTSQPMSYDWLALTPG
ncbi:hypothetical protein VTN96DRAFT_2876 [Rasamsonia emersonii]